MSSSGAGGGQSIGGIGDGVNSDAGGYGAYANAAEEYYEKNTKIKHINMVYFSKYRLTTWYFSPYPDDYGSSVCACARVFVCACVRACVRACVCVCVGIAPPLPSATASPLLCLLLLWCFAGKLPALYVCEYCFKYMAHRDAFLSHECKRRTPPGKEVFRSVPAACCVGAVCICACMRACVCMHVCAGDLRGGC